MKTLLAIVFAGLTVAIPVLAQPYTVSFATAIFAPGARVTDWTGTPTAGTNFWAQLYSADGWTATDGQLAPVGVPVNFRAGINAGWVQVTGVNARGQTINSTVGVSSSTPTVSVQMRSWQGTSLTYEDAVAAGAQHGTSRILRMQASTPPMTPVNLVDAEGPINSFTLSGPPALSINDIVVAEGTNGTVSATFLVTLTPPAAQTVTVGYSTTDGSATAGSDYVATNGTLTFLAGETNKTVTVSITGDATAESDESFVVVLDSPVNAVLAPHFQGTCTITEVHIRDISVDTAVTFNTIAGHVYLLEWANNSTPGTWTTVEGAGNVVGINGLVTVVDKGSGCTTGRIYRARLVQ